MASIRRSLSPAHHDRSFQNGGTAFSVPLPSHNKLFSTAKQPSYLLSMPFLAALANGTHKILDVIFFPRRKRHKSFGQWVFRCAVFFLLGLFIGMTPFGFTQVDDIKSHNVSLEIKNEPFVSLKLDDNPSLKRDDIVKETVYIGVETQVGLNPKFDYIERKLLIVITPTYNRMLQAFYLNRLGQLLRLVPPPILWIVVEMRSSSVKTAEILRNTGVMYRHLVCSMNSSNAKDRGVHQRNTALEHIEHHKLDGIVYFADDDNTYSLELFESLRMIRRFGTWPVAMLAQSKNKAILEGPVCNGSRVIGWHTNEKSKMLRRFHVDMSGFAFNATILWDPKRWKRPASIPIRQLDTVKEGFQETTFIQQVVEDESQMEGLGGSCSRIMNWHLHLEAGSFVHRTLDFVVPI